MFFLSGCASMAPRYEAPALPVAPVYAPETSQDGASASAIGWRDYFLDPHLQNLIRRALDTNRDLRTAVLRVEEARAVHGIQRWSFSRPSDCRLVKTVRGLRPI